MFYTIAVVLLIAWLLGIVGTYTIGAFVHVLLVVALVLLKAKASTLDMNQERNRLAKLYGRRCRDV